MEDVKQKIALKEGGLEKRLKILEDRISYLEENIHRINKSVMCMEVEHEEKLQILFDANSYVREKIDNQEKKLKEYNMTLDRYSDEFYILNSKVQ